MQYDWIARSFTLCRLDKNILFIGRSKKDIIPITFNDGRVVEINILIGQQKESNLFPEKMAACVGESDGVNIGITQQNQFSASQS